MNSENLVLIFSAVAAMVSVGLWVDYFRSIDVFEKEKFWPLIVAIVVGGCTTKLCLIIYGWLDNAGFHETGKFIPDLLYAIFGIGLNEEFCKILGVLVSFAILRKQLSEPIDYLIYGGATALGFSLVENYVYFNNHGIHIITSRAFYSALEHIINTTVIVYGFYCKKLFGKGMFARNVIIAVSLAVASHGLFDFFLRESVAGVFTAFLSLIIYLVGINFWIQMLNNANNFSHFFDYKKIHFSRHLVVRLLLWFALTLIIAFANNLIIVGLEFSIKTMIASLLSDALLFFIVILRVSRFKILYRKYFPIEINFPFYVTKNGDEDFTIPVLNLHVKVRGENSREHLLTRRLYRSVYLSPVNAQTSVIKKPTEVLIAEKFLLFDDVVVYKVNMPETFSRQDRITILKPKMGKAAKFDDQYPVYGLYYAQLPSDTRLFEMHYRDFIFIEWVYIKPF